MGIKIKYSFESLLGKTLVLEQFQYFTILYANKALYLAE